MSDDEMVDKFAAAMKVKLQIKKAEGYRGWQTCAPEVLLGALYKHIGQGCDPVDVANFLAMLWTRELPIREPRLR